MALPEDDVNKQDDQLQDADAAEAAIAALDLEQLADSLVVPDKDAGQDSAEPGIPLTVAEELALALEEVGKFKDTALRKEAEMQNMQRRTARDVENAHKFGVERFIQNLLPVVDSLEKAIEASDLARVEGQEEDAIIEGVRLCSKLLLDVLEREKVEVVDPLGEPFDPNVHQALSMIENPDMEPNSVLAVIQKGYTLHGRLVRPAMVMVVKTPAPDPEAMPDPDA